MKDFDNRTPLTIYFDGPTLAELEGVQDVLASKHGVSVALCAVARLLIEYSLETDDAHKYPMAPLNCRASIH